MVKIHGYESVKKIWIRVPYTDLCRLIIYSCCSLFTDRAGRDVGSSGRTHLQAEDNAASTVEPGFISRLKHQRLRHFSYSSGQASCPTAAGNRAAERTAHSYRTEEQPSHQLIALADFSYTHPVIFADVSWS